MSIFPTQYSTLSSVELKNYLQKKYGFAILGCKYLLRGVNDHYLVETADKKFVFRIYRKSHRSLEEISSELTFLAALHSEGIGVSYPISTINQDQVIEFNAAEGTRYGVLFSYAEGLSVSQLNDVQLANFGKELARIHNVSCNIKLPYERKVYDFDTTMRQPLQSLQPILKNIPDQGLWIKDTIDKVIYKLESFERSEFSYGYCHYDLLPKNFHFDKDKITFFDFDFLGKGYLVNDMMTFWLHLSLNATFSRTSQEEADRSFGILIKSYRGIREISESEIAAIPYLSFAFWIFYMGYHIEHFDDFSNTFFNQKYVIDRIELIKALTDKYCHFNT
jgi:Ser/Thr protein kinase RdoA (MazF antagonist)